MLTHLLALHLGREAFRTLARALAGSDDLYLSLPGDTVSPLNFWGAAMAALEHRGLLGSEFFAAARDALSSAYHAELESLASKHGFSLPRRSHRAVVVPPAMFSPEWFARRFAIVRRNLDRRYRPELHFDVLRRPLDGIVCRSELGGQLQAAIDALADSWRRITRAPLASSPDISLGDAERAVDRLVAAAGEVALDGLAPVILQPLTDALRLATEQLDLLRAKILDILEGTQGRGPRAEAAWDLRRHLVDSGKAISVIETLTQESLRFAATRVIVLLGDAGSGKSHALAHLVESRIASGAPAVMLLGEHFEQGDPWAQIGRNLGLPQSGADDLLHRLEVAAQASGQRALLVIDALNESDTATHRMWRSQLLGMIELLGEHPQVAFVVSLRSSFRQAVLPVGLPDEHVVMHGGFAEREATAVTTFLHRFGLPPPQVPLLTPEHANPLFLVIYCEALAARRAAGDFRELSGFLEVFDAWVEQASGRAAARLEWDIHERLLERGVERLADELARSPGPYISRDLARRVLLEVHPEERYPKSLLKALLDESLIVESEFGGQSVVRFQYERLGDVFMVRALLREHLQRERTPASFGRSRVMRGLLSEAGSNAGKLEALAIVLPQEHGITLHSIVPRKRRKAVVFASLRMLAWQTAKAVDPATIRLVREALDEGVTRMSTVGSLLLLAGRPRHPLNGEFLHGWLAPMTMPDRDAVWSSPDLFAMGDGGVLARLLAWVEHEDTVRPIDADTLMPLALALGWTLSNPDRSIRDRATKALVSLFEDRLLDLARWLTLLQEANDPYVVERVLAVAYGTVLRTDDVAGLGAVASAIFLRWFDPGPPPVDILARDYARGVVEYAHFKGVLDPAFSLERARPPYRSDWPEDLPAMKVLVERLGGRSTALMGSLVGGGDFDRYIVGSNTWDFPWRYVLIGQSDVVEETTDEATVEARTAWEHYIEAFSHVDAITRMVEDPQLRRAVERTRPRARRGAPTLPELLVDARRVLAEAEKALAESGGDRFMDELRAEPRRDRRQFPLEVVRLHLLHAVLELGWSESRFGDDDRRIQRWQSVGRARAFSERLGKKYQWMALHRVLAQIADRFSYGRGLSDRDEGGRYHGPWQIERRNIDPTCRLTRTAAEPFRHRRCWWSPVGEDVWGASLAREDGWMQGLDHLPDPTELLRVVRPDGSTWLVLHARRSWEERHDRELSGLRLPKRRLQYFVRAYVIRTGTQDAFMAWARTKKFFQERALEDVGELTPELMLRERGWSPAWADMNTPYHSRPGWSAPEGLDHELLPAWDLYMVENSEHDATIEDGYTLHMPAVELVELLGLRHSRHDGHFTDARGGLAAFDPSITQAGPRAALLREDLLGPLRDRGFDLVWTVEGEEFLMMEHGRASAPARDLSGAFAWQRCAMTGYLQCFVDGRRDDSGPPVDTLLYPPRNGLSSLPTPRSGPRGG